MDWDAFFKFPEDASVWSVLNSPALVALLAAGIGWQLNRRVRKAEERTQDFVDLVNLQEELEANEAAASRDSPAEAIQEDSTEDFRQEAAGVFDQGDAFIREKMLSARDGRHRRTYKNIAGASMPVRAAALHQRGEITQTQYEGAIELAHEWNQYRRGKAANKRVPKSALEKMRRSLAKLRNS